MKYMGKYDEIMVKYDEIYGEIWWNISGNMMKYMGLIWNYGGNMMKLWG